MDVMAENTAPAPGVEGRLVSLSSPIPPDRRLQGLGRTRFSTRGEPRAVAAAALRRAYE